MYVTASYYFLHVVTLRKIIHAYIAIIHKQFQLMHKALLLKYAFLTTFSIPDAKTKRKSVGRIIYKIIIDSYNTV